MRLQKGNWYVCNVEILNEAMTIAFHRDEVYYCPKDGWIEKDGIQVKVGTLNKCFRLATEKELQQANSLYI